MSSLIFAPSDLAKLVSKAQSGSDPFIAVMFMYRCNTDAWQESDREALLLNMHGNCGSPKLVKLVAVEFLNGTIVYHVHEPLPVGHFEHVQMAAKILHAKGFVFGEFRFRDIMLDGRTVRTVDFHWCPQEDIGSTRQL